MPSDDPGLPATGRLDLQLIVSLVKSCFIIVWGALFNTVAENVVDIQYCGAYLPASLEFLHVTWLFSYYPYYSPIGGSPTTLTHTFSLTPT